MQGFYLKKDLTRAKVQYNDPYQACSFTISFDNVPKIRFVTLRDGLVVHYLKVKFINKFFGFGKFPKTVEKRLNLAWILLHLSQLCEFCANSISLFFVF